MYDPKRLLRRQCGGAELAWHGKQQNLHGTTVYCPNESPIEIGTPNGSRNWVLATRDELRVVWAVRHYQAGDPAEGLTFFHGNGCIVEVSGFRIGYSVGAFRQLLLDELNFRLRERDIERLTCDGSDLLVPSPQRITIIKRPGDHAQVIVEKLPRLP